MDKSSSEQAIDYICHKDWRVSRLGLGRVINLLNKIGNPQDSLKFVHIAGTNGKGSTAAMTYSILKTAGYRTGLYTSPYLHVFNERIQVNDRCISDEELSEITQYVKKAAEEMDDHPTEFELISVIAFEYFKRQKCDIVVLEVGLGGRLDATNVIKTSQVSVITAIGLDHTEILGNTLDAIAREKAGIIKEGCPVVLYHQSQEIEDAVREVAQKNNAQLIISQFDKIIPVSHDLNGQYFDYKDMKNLKLSLLGEHQLKNVATVLAIVDTLQQKGWNIKNEDIRKGLQDTIWPARFELLAKEPYFIVDGGHNPQCMMSVAQNIEAYFQNKKAVILTGVMADKDYRQMYRIIAPYACCFVAVTPDNERALPAQKLGEFLSEFNKPIYVQNTIKEGIEKAIELSKQYDNLAVAVGSLYMSGDIRKCFGYDIYSKLK